MAVPTAVDVRNRSLEVVRAVLLIKRSERSDTLQDFMNRRDRPT